MFYTSRNLGNVHFKIISFKIFSYSPSIKYSSTRLFLYKINFILSPVCENFPNYGNNNNIDRASHSCDIRVTCL